MWTVNKAIAQTDFALITLKKSSVTSCTIRLKTSYSYRFTPAMIPALYRFRSLTTRPLMFAAMPLRSNVLYTGAPPISSSHSSTQGKWIISRIWSPRLPPAAPLLDTLREVKPKSKRLHSNWHTMASRSFHN